MRKALFFGDSNTYGYDPAGFMGGRYPRNARWTTILQDLLDQPEADIGTGGPAAEIPGRPAAGGRDLPGETGQEKSALQTREVTAAEEKISEAEKWEIVSDGMPGRALPRTRYEWDYLRSLLQREMPLDLFGVMLGTNDLLSTLRPDAARTAREMNDLLAFVEEILAQTPSGPQILLIAPPEIILTDQSYLEPYVCGGKSYARVYHEEGQLLSRYYQELAAYRQIHFADASAWKLAFAFDGVHLSEKGHALFAQEMAQVLRGL